MERHFVEGIADGSLAGRIESADLVNAIVIEDDPHRVFFTVVDIDHPPSNGKIPGLLHKIGAPVSGGRQAVGQETLVEGLASNQPLDLCRNRDRQGQGSEERAHRHDDDAHLVVGDSPKEANELEPGCKWGLGALIGSAEVTGHASDSETGSEQLEPGREIIHISHMRHHHDGKLRTETPGYERRHRQGSGPGDDSADRKGRVAVIEGFDQRSEIGQGVVRWRSLH